MYNLVYFEQRIVQVFMLIFQTVQDEEFISSIAIPNFVLEVIHKVTIQDNRKLFYF